MESLKDKVILVSGGSIGIGKAIVRDLCRYGAKVVFCSRRVEEGRTFEKELQNEGNFATYIPCDISRKDEVKALVDKTIELYGKLDAAVNNAGILGPQVSLLDYPEEEWDKMVNVNLKGTYLCMKYEIEEMLKQGKGSIVNMSSVAGILGGYRGLIAYSATKHAIVGLSKSAAWDYGAKGIRINTLCPGTIDDTGMIEEVVNSTKDPQKARENMPNFYPMRRLGKTSEIASAVSWLCSDESSFVSGIALPVDGGFSAQ
ncbi:MAG: glucose 1-dehydrogenase [Leptospiraceae bacterium]|nr:glucose 1-dehydrogenase [Leptospiraceae bacterium]MCP5502995.1 glucose 1-dehydrogenase [Leptospiraceae bacterium]